LSKPGRGFQCGRVSADAERVQSHQVDWNDANPLERRNKITSILKETVSYDSEPFDILVSGGADRQTVYVALIEAQTGQELARFTGENHNALREAIFESPQHAGKEVRVRIVDAATGSWGHINFGGIFALPDGK
jgi:hypothetical protein